MNPSPNQIKNAEAFYRRAMRLLQQKKFPFLVGGAYAFRHFTGIRRYTKDLDLFIRPADCGAALRILSAAGYRTEVTAPHWLGKVFHNQHYIDLIIGFSNGIGHVDNAWFKRSVKGTVCGLSVRLTGAEEMIWMKAFVQDRDRFDGADVAHLIYAGHKTLDWALLLDLFDDHWRVLLSHLVLFGFIYPGERRKIPEWVMDRLLRRLQAEKKANEHNKLCQGPLLSHTEYATDIEKWKFRDTRLLAPAIGPGLGRLL
jgi:hypothetical protein